MTPDKNSTPTPYWKKLRVLGLVFLIAGITLSVIDRRSEALLLAGLGPGFAVGGIVILSASFVFWSNSRRTGRDR